jgi:hypothetical protein
MDLHKNASTSEYYGAGERFQLIKLKSVTVVRILDFSGVGVLDDLTRRMRRGQNGVKQSSIEGG